MYAGICEGAQTHRYALILDRTSIDNASQQREIERLITRRVDAIVLTPYDSEEIDPAISEANVAGIPVFTADIASGSENGNVVGHVESDNVAGGRAAARLLVNAIQGHGYIAIIDQPNVTSVRERVHGFQQYLAPYLERKSITKVADDVGGPRQKAAFETGLILQAHREVNGIFGINDEAALGAVDAVSKARLTRKISIVGYDGSPEALQAFRQGRLYGEVLQHPRRIGVAIINLLAAYLRSCPRDHSGKCKQGPVTKRLPVTTIEQGHGFRP